MKIPVVIIPGTCKKCGFNDTKSGITVYGDAHTFWCFCKNCGVEERRVDRKIDGIWVVGETKFIHPKIEEEENPA